MIYEWRTGRLTDSMLHSLVGSSSSSCEEGGSDEGGVVSNETNIVQSLKKNPTVKNEKDRAEGGIDFKKVYLLIT